MSAQSNAPALPAPPVVVQFPRRRPVFPARHIEARPVTDDRPNLHDACALLRSAEVLRELATQLPGDRTSETLTQVAAIMHAHAWGDGAEVVRLVNVMGRW
ncbi:hypothetical protein [Rhodovarius lipocyclicus]|uniref:hypothetical protein n=1 Tax=Rhodovarius lipocyclicus TaxID=268410 RepID=UPI001358D6EE|nr:hypothetical protein [Rhodovarius lipocyclicus]